MASDSETGGAGERRLATLLDSATEFAVIGTDPRRLVLVWNRGAERLLGWSAETMHGAAADRVFTDEDVAAGVPEREAEEARASGRAADERWHVRRDGTRFWGSGEMMPWLDEGGGLLGFVKIMRDRTLERRAEELRAALMTLSDRLRGMEDTAAMASAAATLLGRTLAASRAGYGTLDASRECLVVEGDWTDEGIDTVAGRHRLREFWASDFAAAMARGEPVAVADVTVDARTNAAPFSRVGVRAALNLPVIEGGRPVAVFFLHQSVAREWTEEEIGFAREVTERTRVPIARRRAAESLRASEAHWRGLFERLDEGLVLGEVVRDEAGRVTDWRCLEVNAGWAALVGVPAADAVGRTVRELFPAVEPGWIEEVAHVVESGRPVRSLRAVGSTGRWCEGRTYRVGPERFAAIFIEVTERRAAETRRAALLAMDDRLRDMEDPVEMAYATAEILGQTLEVSRAGYGTIDKDRETISIERDWSAPGVASLAGVLHFRDYGSYIENLKRGEMVVIADARTDPRTRATAAALEAITARAVLNMPVTEQGGLVALLYLNHATAREWPADELAFVREAAERTRNAIERRRAENDLRALTASLEAEVEARTAELMSAEAALRQSQKMEAVGQLTGGIAHDFNNLLAGITGNLELLSARMAQGQWRELERYVSAADGAARRAASLTQRLLAFSRRQALEPKPTDVNRLVAGMVELVRRTVGPGIDVEVVAAGGLWATLVDPGQLENALLNLCINARDAMPEGGRLTIETGNGWLDERGAAEQELPAGQFVSLCVSDNGVGMETDVVERAFDPFFTTKPIGQGTGLGLSMVYGFARQSGGQARIISEPGQGTTVRLTLPRHAAAADEAGEGPPLHEAPETGRGETVLVVDDEPTIRMLVAEVLEEAGYNVLQAGDGAAALSVLATEVAIDLLVTDVGLPGGANGRQVADAARVTRPGLKVLFITGFAENAVLSHGHLPAGMHVLTKPFAMEVLASRVRGLV